MSDAPHEQYRPQEAQQAPQQLAWQPSATDYHSFGAGALDQRAQANNNLIGIGLLTDLQFNFSTQEAPVMLAYNQKYANQDNAPTDSVQPEAPGAFKLGAVFNDTFNQSLATQFEDLGAKAIKGIGSGIQHIMQIGEKVGEIAKDVASVAKDDLQIGYEKLTYPALAEANSDVLSQKLHQMGSEYEQKLQPIKQAYTAVENGLEAIGAKADKDPHQYERLITEPSKAISGAVDKFTSQTPGAQIEAITDQSTQLFFAGVAGKIVGAASGAFRLEEMSAKFDQLFLKMEETKLAHAPAEPKLAGAFSNDSAKPSDNMLMSKADDLNKGKGKDALNSSIGKGAENLEHYISKPINGAERSTPLGFKDQEQFFQAAHELTNALKDCGITDATLGVRGSSVTGYSDYKGTLFHGESDVDFFFESAQVAKLDLSKGEPFVKPKLLTEEFPQLKEWSEHWTAILGRPISPAAFAPGTLPPTPAIKLKSNQ